MIMKKNILVSGIAWIALVAASPVVPGPVTLGVPARGLTEPSTIASPVVAAANALPLEDLVSLRDAAGAAWSADGRHIIMSINLTGRYNLWSVPVDGGFPQQLIQSEETQGGIVTSRDGKEILFEADKQGNSIYDIFSIASNGGAARNLNNTPDISESRAIYPPVGRVIAISRRPANEPSSNIALLDLATGKTKNLTNEREKEYSWSPVGFTSDGRSLIANRHDADHIKSAIYSINIATARAQALTPTGNAYHEASALSDDSRWIALATDDKIGVRQAALMDLRAANKVTFIQPSPWEQSSGAFTPDSRSVSFTTNVDGRTKIALAAVGGGAITAVDLPEGVNNDAGFSPDGKTMLLAHSSGSDPFEFWTGDLNTGTVKQFTRFGLASLNPASLPKTRLVHYASADGTVISAFVWIPPNLKRDGTARGIVLPHGGPSEQQFDNFNATAAALASRGYFVIAPNFRGSTGYGTAFKLSDRYDLGGGDLIDTNYAARFLVATGYVDKNRIGITGGSYGGFMTLMALGRSPDVYAAGVAGYGIVNWFTMYTDQDISVQQYQRALIGDPVINKDAYIASSPLTYLDKVKVPLLVLQGDNDPQVPRTEAEQVIKILKSRNQIVEGKFYPDEGHGFNKRENVLDALERTINWFDKYLKK
jgi:dipeptidyl aminopeptidase/acylaminoacyl peptidase